MTLKKIEEGIYAQESTANEIRDIDGIIFDCDGVLVDVSNSYDLAIQRTTAYILKEIANISKFDPVTSKIIDGIIFDCDGVLVDVSNSYDLAIQRTTAYILKEIANISKFDPVTSKIID